MKKIIFVALAVVMLLSPSTLTFSAEPTSIFSPSAGTGTIINGSEGVTINPSNSSFVSNSLSTGTSAKTSAASSGGCRIPTNIGELFTYALCILDSSVIPFLIGLGLILFLTGVLKFVSSGDNEEARQGGRNMMMFGIISLFVMVSIWGFVNILSRSFFGTDSEIQSLPKKSPNVFKPY